MLSKLHIILIILLISEIILDDCDAKTSVSIRNDCFSVSLPNSYCCFDGTGQKCVKVEKKELGEKPEYDCGITEENYGKYEFDEYHPKQEIEPDMGLQTCGKQDPKNVEDCTEYSELGNSCCWFQNGGQQGCFLIGKRYDKDHIKGNFGDISYDCKSSNIIFNMYSILLLLLFIN